MEARGMAMLFAYTAALHLALALFCIWRLMWLQRALPAERPTFVVTMPRAAPIPPGLDARAEQAGEAVLSERTKSDGTSAEVAGRKLCLESFATGPERRCTQRAHS
jgi:hypothetical protein